SKRTTVAEQAVTHSREIYQVLDICATVCVEHTWSTRGAHVEHTWSTRGETMTRTKAVQVKKLSNDQAKKMFDRQRKHYLKMTGKEFIQKWDSGQCNGKAYTPAVTRVAMLLLFGR